MICGYARVSTDGQSLAAQVEQLTEAGAEKVFPETTSGARSDRPQLRRALAKLDRDDVFLVARLDRLARSTRDLLNTLATISTKGASFRSLGDAWADTTTAHGRLILTVTRTTEGRARAKAAGVKLGCKPTLTPHHNGEAIKRRRKGESPTVIARSYNVSRWTIQRLSEFI